MFAAARACEDRLHDPARALKLYRRVVELAPNARIEIPAMRRADALFEQVGARGEYAQEAADLSKLIAEADTAHDVIARAEALIAKPWPGAPDAELWLAEWLRGHGDYAAAQQHYASLARRWPGSPQAMEGARDAAGCALDAHDWELAERLARELPGGDPVEDAARAEVIAAAKRGRDRDTLVTGSWLALALAAFVLLASLADAIARGGRRWPALRPPFEVMFFAPLATLLVGVAWLAQRTIAPAVTRISLVGLALAWLSGSALDLMRARGRATRARSLLHVGACVLGIAAIAYLSITHDHLIDLIKAQGAS